MRIYYVIVYFVIYLTLSEAASCEENLDKLVIPEKFFSAHDGESGLIVYCPNQSRIVKPARVINDVIFDLGGRGAVVLELDRRDEDVWSQSVTSAWKVTPFTQIIINRFDLRTRNRMKLKLENFPSSVHAAVFYKFSENGVSDWVRIYEAVVNSKLQCELMGVGIWICVPIGKDGENMYNISKFINLQESDTILNFNMTPEVPKEIQSKIDQATFFSIKDVVRD